MDRVATLREAWEKVVGQSGHDQPIDLITDGGPENINRTVDTFLEEEKVHMNRKIALEDLAFSNSMVEATNKIVKYHYLFPAKLKHGVELKNRLPEVVHDFNEVRPHHQLRGLTPAEAYAGQGVNTLLLDRLAQKARKVRKEANQSHLCKVCKG
mgnify:CR=1 FL=1